MQRIVRRGHERPLLHHSTSCGWGDMACPRYTCSVVLDLKTLHVAHTNTLSAVGAKRNADSCTVSKAHLELSSNTHPSHPLHTHFFFFLHKRKNSCAYKLQCMMCWWGASSTTAAVQSLRAARNEVKSGAKDAVEHSTWNHFLELICLREGSMIMWVRESWDLGFGICGQTG